MNTLLLWGKSFLPFYQGKLLYIFSFVCELNCSCGMVDRQKAFSLIFRRDRCQRSSPSRISNTPQAGFEPAQNLSSGFVEWSCAVVITTYFHPRNIFYFYTSVAVMGQILTKVALIPFQFSLHSNDSSRSQSIADVIRNMYSDKGQSFKERYNFWKIRLSG